MQRGPSLGTQYQLQATTAISVVDDQMQQPFFLYIWMSFNSRFNHLRRKVTWTSPVERI